jgi:aminopeptidase
MSDPRVKKMAEVLVNYSLALKKGDKFLISGHAVTEPLIKEVYQEALKVGAHPMTNISIGLGEFFYKYADDDQLTFINPVTKMIYEEFDAILTIWGESNTKALSGVDPRKIAKNSAAQAELSHKFMERIASGDVKWCGTQFPTHASAQDADMSLTEYEDFVYGSCKLNEDDPAAYWKGISEQQEKIAEILNSKKELHFLSEGTDLKVNVEGRKWINCDGKQNFPDGEIFTTPIKESANGKITFAYPAIYNEREVEGIQLTFENGKVVKATALKGEDYLNTTLDTDEGSRYLGEVAIGTNYGIQNFTKNILFDEKIGGTIHLAVGAGFPETGGDNKSGIHWDMICEMKEEGKIYADGELIYEKGKFLI